jgi:hypothetical protein
MKFKEVNLQNVDIRSVATLVVFTRLFGPINTSTWDNRLHVVLTNCKISSKSLLVIVYHYSKTLVYRQELFDT